MHATVSGTCSCGRRPASSRDHTVPSPVAPWPRRRRIAAIVFLALATTLAAADSPSADDRYRAPFPGRLARDGDLLYALNDPPEPGAYAHPAGLYVIRFPASWRMIRSVTAGNVACMFSAEAGRVPPKRIRTGVKVQAVAMSDVFRHQRLSAAAIMKHLLPGTLREEPGVKVVGEIVAAKLGSLDAALCRLEGRWGDEPGDSVHEVLIAEREGVAFQLTGFAPTESYAEFRETFREIARASTFGRAGLPRRDRSMEAREIVQRYKRSVVSILATSEQKGGTGTGFIVSRDGYILTNYHVAYDTQTGQPMTSFTVQWDDTLKRPKVSARLIGGRLRLSSFQMQYGTDVALLKIPSGEYEPLPLSPLGDVDAGDGVVTLGFPSRGLLEGISLTVTSGVVTRFNRSPQGDIDSIFVDAAFTHGSSGGPCVSLVTGGVIGLNAFGMDVQLDPRLAKLNDLIEYHGVVPIDAAIREFPLVCLRLSDRDGGTSDFFDCLELSKYLLSTGSLAAAEQLASRAVTLEPEQAIAHQRLGECRFEQALEKQASGDAAKAQSLFAGARQAYTSAIAREPRSADALAAFARLEIQENRLREAAALATRAAAAEPKGWAASLLLADIRLREGQLDDALGFAEKAKAVVGGLIVNPHVTAAQILQAKEDFARARDEWTEAARISPIYLPARLGVAACCQRTGEVERALAEYRRILDDFPENGEVLGRLGLCLNQARRPAEANECFQKSVQRCRAAGQAPDESVLMFLGDALMQRPDSAEAVPIFALYLFHHRGGTWAALASLKLASIHAQHRAPGLASAHARLALQLQPDPNITQAAQSYPAAPLALDEIRALLALQYPPPLAAQLVAESPLGFSLDEAELARLQREGMPEAILRAILSSLSRQPVVPTGIGSDDFVPPPGGGFSPPGPTAVGPTAPPSSAAAPDLRGTWVATGVTPQQVLFRSVIIFGDFGLFTSDTWVGFQSLGPLRGNYRFENGRLILQPEGGRAFTPNFQLDQNGIVMDVPNFAPGVRFVRENSRGEFPP